MRPQDEELAAFRAHVDLAVGEHRRRLLDRPQILLPQLAAGRDVERPHPRSVLDLVDAIAIDHRRREAELHPFHRPLRLLDVAGLRSVDRGDQTELFRVEVLVAMRHDHGAAFDHSARVDRALGHDKAPDLFTRLRLDRLIAAVPVAADQQTHPVDRGNERRRIGGIVRSSSRRRDIHDVACAFVERDESQRAVPQRAPVRHGRVHEHQVAIDERGHRPAAMRRERREFLTDRSLPQELAILVQCDDQRAAAERVDVAGLRIGGGGRPAHTMGGDVALKDVELVFPDHPAGIGVERHHSFLERGAAARRVLDVDAIAHHDRRRAAAVRRAPQEILAVERPPVDEAGFRRDAVAMRTSRLGPVAERDAPRTLGRGHDADNQHERAQQR